MRILVIGKGGREHALGWKFSLSDKKPEIFFMPGNGGTVEIGENIDGDYNDFDEVVSVVHEKGIDLVVVGPEDPIANGIADYLKEKGINVVAPYQDVAFLEASKIEAKRFMERNGIPTASFHVFTDYDEAIDFVEETDRYPLVVKADGLCAGKGVVIAENKTIATRTLKEFMRERKFKDASKRVVIEEYLTGYEFSVFAFVKGADYTILGDAIDYKRAYDNDMGPNTGGMGSIAPCIFLKDNMREHVQKEVVEKTVNALVKEGYNYYGFLYFGLMWTDKGPYVLEYNVRMGDPETQVVAVLDKRDWLDIVTGRVLDKKWHIHEGVCAEVVLVSGGYPIEYKKGVEIEGLDGTLEIKVFHAGTIRKNGRILTNGGRVLNFVYCASSLEEARKKVYEAVKKVGFENMFYRKDIGDKKRWKGIL